MQPQTTDLAQPDAFYESHFPILAEIASSRFNIPEADAEELAHEVLLASLGHLDTPEPEVWLHASLTYAARRRSGGK